MGGNNLSIPVMITGGYIWIVLCRHQTAAHMQICLHFLCQKKKKKKKIIFMWSMTLKNSKLERFLCKSRERFIIIVAQRRGIYVDG